MSFQLTIEIEGDYNDGDYKSMKSEITQEQLDRFKPIFDILKEFKIGKEKHPYSDLHNWRDYGEVGYSPIFEDLVYDEKTDEANYDLLDEFAAFVPYVEDVEIHTIISINTYTTPEVPVYENFKTIL